jgi:uncharacterized GH25 family protein
MRPFACAVLAVLAVLLSAAPAAAHEFWLSPSTYRPVAGDVVSVSMVVGTGFRGEVKPYATPRTVRFVLRGARETDMSGLSTNGDPVSARFKVAGGEGQLLAYESNFASIELPAKDFDAYLKTEGLDVPLAARAHLGAAEGPGRERYARCPKAWIGSGAEPRATQPAGLTMEIVPLADPTTASPLPVRVLFHGQPLAGVLVRAWNRSFVAGGASPADPSARDSLGPVVRVRTDARGEARLRATAPGEWMVSAVHMEPSSDRAAADWQSWWASLTFGRVAR